MREINYYNEYCHTDYVVSKLWEEYMDSSSEFIEDSTIIFDVKNICYLYFKTVDIKPFPEPMLICHQWYNVIIWSRF